MLYYRTFNEICKKQVLFVQVVWMADNWDIPPDTDKVFNCIINFPRNGKVIQLENIHVFQERWGKEELVF